VLGDKGGGAQLVHAGHLLLAWHGVIYLRIDRDLSVCSRFFDGVGVYVRVCVCTRTHTHTLKVGFSDASPGVGTRQRQESSKRNYYIISPRVIIKAIIINLEGLKNPDGLNLGIYVFVHVYKVHTCRER